METKSILITLSKWFSY